MFQRFSSFSQHVGIFRLVAAGACKQGAANKLRTCWRKIELLIEGYPLIAKDQVINWRISFDLFSAAANIDYKHTCGWKKAVFVATQMFARSMFAVTEKALNDIPWLITQPLRLKDIPWLITWSFVGKCKVCLRSLASGPGYSQS